MYTSARPTQHGTGLATNTRGEGVSVASIVPGSVAYGEAWQLCLSYVGIEAATDSSSELSVQRRQAESVWGFFPRFFGPK